MRNGSDAERVQSTIDLLLWIVTGECCRSKYQEDIKLQLAYTFTSLSELFYTSIL